MNLRKLRARLQGSINMQELVLITVKPLDGKIDASTRQLMNQLAMCKGILADIDACILGEQHGCEYERL